MNANTKVSCLIITFIFITCRLSAQCPQADLVFKSKDDLDNFAINYPNCNDVPGSILITEPDRWINDRTIKNLKGLDNIRSI